MYRQLCCVEPSIQPLRSVLKGSVLVPPRNLSARPRRRLHSSTSSRLAPIHSILVSKEQSAKRQSHSSAQNAVYLDEEASASDSFDANTENLAADSFSFKKEDTRFSDHLNGVFPPLRFPPELARRVLTHGSHKAAINGHNSRFSFIGRRVLEAYLLLFLQSSPARQPFHDYELISSRALNSHVLGEHVAPHWGLGRMLRWVAPIPSSPFKKPEGVEQGKRMLRSVGLYKVQGDAVQAVMGGIFHQFGGSVTHRIFHTRLLPKILLPKRADGLLDVFHEDALAACERMGGLEGKLLLSDRNTLMPTAIRDQTNMQTTA